jgi:Na+-driven multidrug efflux pump
MAWVLGLQMGYGIVGMWSAAVAYVICAAITMTVKFRGGSWKNIKL